MKSKEQIKDLLEQYEFDIEMNKLYFPDKKHECDKSNLIVNILKWVLDDEDIEIKKE